ncbi:glycerophosphodiester phosphodiesterase [Thermosipho melanesiensis]|uniref:Glycerophosphoryl diester phosphodiesterase n=2 Tax=Thermosipho melanesiensis TaxID=46541 RepID=A6LMP3_THEM4|nr:glycerophosphodiester phosphodiesterase family protein [Thermosipho melanesiensis]ABR31194.1 glycerophosphoryl diester phosphodiesterase [Thermosipho melanesiensis BI429]APT74283.1 glycerophosphodiester phosphodiesterase [Thermosipho melanesiensis]OOC36222.1 glycerophosphodiester phosphodiesterase [Thermosipho melanesiensis]OOC37040.1 glycerophosphodiester phosphodiesterase [Thermosipho melanesiensis]OOC37792.1 glycerophosphodiester phosphodiesterase [Thermosipho melanesiensis]
MKILGHRGYSEKYVENTLESFQKAIEYGADGVELDVYWTKDGEVVVTHDSNLKRVFNVDLDVREVNSKKIPKNIPRLYEIFEIMLDDKIINVEIKDANNAEKIVQYVLKKRKQEIIFSSFEHDIIIKLSRIYGNEKFGLLFDERHKNLNLNDLRDLFYKTNIFSAHIPIQLYYIDEKLFFEFLTFLKKLGKKIVIWTVNSEEEVEMLKGLADYIITDCVEKIVGYLKKTGR